MRSSSVAATCKTILILITFSALYPSASYAQNPSGSNSTKHPALSAERVQNLIRDYTENTLSDDQKLALIGKLMDQRYEEVRALAKKEIISLVQAPRPSVEVLYAWLITLQQAGVYNDYRLMDWAQKKIQTGKTKISPQSKYGQQVLEMIEETKNTFLKMDPKETLPLLHPSTLLLEDRSSTLEQTTALISKLKDEKKYSILNAALDNILTKDILNERASRKWTRIIRRNREVDEASNILVRMNSRVPLIVGEPGVGKSSVVRGITEEILDGKLPPGIHAEELSRAIVIQTSPSKIAALADQYSVAKQMAAIRLFFLDVANFQKNEKTNVIVVMEEANRLSEAQIDALKPILSQTQNPINLILVSDSQQASLKLLGNPELTGQIEKVSVSEFDSQTTFDLIKQSHLAKIESHYNVTISDDVLKDAIEIAGELRPDLHRPVGPLKLLQDLAIGVNRKAQGVHTAITQKDLFTLASQRAQMPVVPQDRQAFLSHMDQVKKDIKSVVKGQDASVDTIVNLFSETMTSKGKKSRAAFIVGTTGTGKTLIATTLAKKFFGSTDRVLRIDMNQLKADDSGNYLFGPKAGYIGSDKSKGLLTEFVDRIGSGPSIIILDEIEKAHPSQIERLMEPIDTNSFIPGDGRPRHMGRVLWIATSNQGATNFFPSDFLKTATPEQVAEKMATVTSDDVKNAFLQPESMSQNVVKPEVLARFDAFILQAPVLKPTAIQIASLKANEQIEHYREQGLGKISVDADFSKVFAEEVYDPTNGVRELERRIRSEIDRIYNEHLRTFGASESLTIATNPPAPGAENVTFAVTNERGQALTVNGPKFAFQNPMLNPVLRDRLKSLETDLNHDVFGQSAYAHKLAASVRDNVIDQDSKKPVSVYVSGGTGTGKTEMVRSLSNHLFGSEEYLLKLEMGTVSSVKDLSNIFQPAAGYIGSDRPGEFERFLQSHTQGVIVFDEMGNAGGNDKNAKEEIGKYLYSILDDGVWVSPVTKRTYSLKNYVFVFTGNEAEKLFEGYSADDMLRSIWKKNSSEDQARELLRKSGLSPAFVGRIGAVIITEPPTTETKVLIAKKMVSQWKNRIEAKQPVKIEMDEPFIDQITRLTYSPSEGARSILNFVKTTLGAAVSSGIFDIDFTQATSENPALVKVSLEIKSPAHPFYTVKPDEKLAKVHVQIVQGGKTVYQGESDFTSSARFMKQIKYTDAVATAFHEAGHAVLNDPRMTGRKLDHLTIVPADHYLGYARYDDIPGFTTNYTREALLSRLAVLVAGSESELLIGRAQNSGQSGDLEQERSLLTRAATEWGLVPELHGVKLNDKGVAQFTQRQEEVFENFANEMLGEARKIAHQKLEENWYLIALVSRELIVHGEITGTRYEALVQKAMTADHEFKQKFMAAIGPEQVKARLNLREDQFCNQLLHGE